jgi:CheY-like chemotaxis protein
MQDEQDRASILIVDDTPANLRLLSQLLGRRGYKVRAVASGLRALEAVRLVPPDLILLDVMMPDMDGYEVCAHLKADEKTRNIPVIFISALGETLDKVRAFSVGAMDYVTKPFQADEVLARITTHLGIQELRRQLEKANRELVKRNADLETRNAELQEALSAIKTLSGLVPICAWCGSKIQDDAGRWVKVEAYIEAHSEAEFTHGICPECLAKLKVRT